MKTTLNIDPVVFARLKEESARRGETMSSLVEQGLRLLFDAKPAKRKLKPLPTFDMGEPLVDIANHDALMEALERD